MKENIIIKQKIQVPRSLRRMLTVILLLLFIGSLLALFYYLKFEPNIEKQEAVYNYKHKGEITYQSQVKPSMINPGTTLKPGQTIYFKLLENLKTFYSYDFKADKNANIKGSYYITATLEAKEMWKLDFTLLPKKEFNKTGDSFSLREEIPINLFYFYSVLDQVEKEIGVVAREPKLIIKQNISVEASSQEGTIKEDLNPTMVIPLTGGGINIGGELADEKEGSLKETILIQNPFKNYALTLTIIFGAILMLFPLMTQNKPVKAVKYSEVVNDIKQKYGERMVTVREELFPDQIIEISSMEDLVKIADELCKPILNQVPLSLKGINTYYIFDGSIAYRFILDPSNFIAKHIKPNYTKANFILTDPSSPKVDI